MRVLEIAPSPCTLCGAGNTPTNDGSRRRFVDLERDVNWNDPLILCEDCVMRVGGVIGMQSPDEDGALQQHIKELDQKIFDLEAEIDSMTRRATRLGIKFDERAKATA
jgi:hypothetical protein